VFGNVGFVTFVTFMCMCFCVCVYLNDLCHGGRRGREGEPLHDHGRVSFFSSCFFYSFLSLLFLPPNNSTPHPIPPTYHYHHHYLYRHYHCHCHHHWLVAIAWSLRWIPLLFALSFSFFIYIYHSSFSFFSS